MQGQKPSKNNPERDWSNKAMIIAILITIAVFLFTFILHYWFFIPIVVILIISSYIKLVDHFSALKKQQRMHKKLIPFLEKIQRNEIKCNICQSPHFKINSTGNIIFCNNKHYYQLYLKFGKIKMIRMKVKGEIEYGRDID